jgi:hypothetical protein
MTTGGLLPQLAMVLGFIAGALICCVIARALWSEIGPMVRLMFRRASRTRSNDNDRIGLKH